MGKKVGNWYQYSGVIHIHTTDSDGTRSLKEVIDLGREVGVDFLMFTDHMTLKGRDSGREGYYGDTLVLIGYEHNDPDDKHHYLLFDAPAVYPRDIKAAELVSQAASDGALGIIAHPDEVKKRTRPFRSYPWLDWSVDGFQGIEIWNQMSEWMDKLSPFNKILLAFSPRKSMVGPRKQTLERWDRLNMTRKVAGIACPDAHAYPVRVWPLTVEIFPYKVHFKALRTHLLLAEPMAEDLETARRQVYDAIRDCRLYISNMRWGVADDFQFRADTGEEEGIVGSRLKLTDRTTLHVSLPEPATLKVVANGTVVIQTVTDRLDYKVAQPGIYRVEAWKNGRGWIFSNHIRIVASEADG